MIKCLFWTSKAIKHICTKDHNSLSKMFQFSEDQLACSDIASLKKFTKHIDRLDMNLLSYLKKNGVKSIFRSFYNVALLYVLSFEELIYGA